MTQEYSPSPDELLEALKKEEQGEKSGKLKIFFGMCAGVGKTYSMLEEAHIRQKEGVNIVVGIVNTHGRIETERLLEGLTVIPKKWITYHDALFEELDLEAILRIKPELVLVDELAHTNVPGSTHPKRWQDIEEILRAGIDVYTTLNVQHIESRRDIVEGVSGIQIRETVPDSILERADTVELVDITPEELLERLKDGKVYLGDKSKIAIEHFFKKETLTALRELALRLTAEKVEHDLHSLLSKGRGWTTREKLLVAISASPYSEQLLRQTRKRAFELDAPWVAVYVDTGKVLSELDQERLAKHFSLAQNLGAEIVTTYDTDIARGIQRIAKQKNCSQVVIGRPPVKTFWNFFSKTYFETLEEENKDLDILLIRQDKIPKVLVEREKSKIQFKRKLWEFSGVFLSLGLLTLFGYHALPIIGYESVGYFFLLAILFFSFFVGRGPIFFAALLSAFSWDFFFIPPAFSLAVENTEDQVLLVIYFLTAAISGTMTSRLHEKDYLLNIREERAQRLLEIEKAVASDVGFEAFRKTIIQILEKIFPASVDLLISNVEHTLILTSHLVILQDEKEKATAVWCFEHAKIAGKNTDTLPSAQATYFPIQSAKSTLGVLVLVPHSATPLSYEEKNYLQAICGLLSSFFERVLAKEKGEIQYYTNFAERLHTAIMHAVSKTFNEPLKKLFESVEKLKSTQEKTLIDEITKDIHNVGATLQIIIDNVVTISEIESGFLKLTKTKNDLRDLIRDAILEISFCSPKSNIKFQKQDQSIIANIDLKLLKLAIKNILLNAIESSPEGGEVAIEMQGVPGEISIIISDSGTGIPEELHGRVFEKFYRLESTKGYGLGLGLSLVKIIVEGHDGKISVKNKVPHGTQFTILLPF